MGFAIGHQHVDHLADAVSLRVENTATDQAGYENSGCAHRDTPLSGGVIRDKMPVMTDARNNARRKMVGPTIPKGFVVGEFTNYLDASAMVERLIANEFKPHNVSIIGHDPVLVEQVRSRLGYGRVALSGLITGFWIGLIFAVLIGAGITVGPDGEVGFNSQQFMAVLVVSCGIGMLFNIVRFSLAKNRRGFLSSQTPVATRYEVVVPESEAAKAQQALSAGNS